MLTRISEFEVEKLSISNYKSATYLQCNKQSFEIQTEWITLGKYQKLITDGAKSINLSIPISKGDDTYIVLSAIDDNLSKLKIFSSKKYHPLIYERDRGKLYIKFKIYLNTGLFDKDKNRVSITSLHDVYQYLREDTQVKIVFGFTKLWSTGKDFGFSMAVRRILLKDEVKEVSENKLDLLDDN